MNYFHSLKSGGKKIFLVLLLLAGTGTGFLSSGESAGQTDHQPKITEKVHKTHYSHFTHFNICIISKP